MKKITLLFRSNEFSAYLFEEDRPLIKHVLSQGGHFFEKTDVDAEQLSQFLLRHGVDKENTEVSVIVDVINQDYQISDIPFLKGKDRDTFLAREFQKTFFSMTTTPFTATVSLGYKQEKGKRKEETVLMISVAEKKLIQPWLDYFNERSFKIAGFWSIDQAIPFLKAIKKNEYQIVLSQIGSAIRLTLIYNGIVRYSQLSDDISLEQVAEQEVMFDLYVSEIKELLHFLKQGGEEGGLKYLDYQSNADLSINILTQQPDDPRLRAMISKEIPGIAVQFISFRDEMPYYKMTEAPTSNDSERFLVSLLQRNVPKLQFLPVSYGRLFQLSIIEERLKKLGWVVGLLMLGLGFIIWLWSFFLQSNTEDLLMQRDQVLQSYEKVLSRLPEISMSRDTVRQVVASLLELQQLSVGPKPLLIELSRSLDEFPSIGLRELSWAITSGPTQAVFSGEQFNEKELSFGTLTVSAALPVRYRRDPRVQLSMINSFVESLHRNHEIQAEILTRPFELESSKALKSDTTQEATINEPRFSIRIDKNLLNNESQ